MARKTCPSCGAVYNGRKCRECLFVPFTEEIAHGLHTHEGEPLVIEEGERKLVRRPGPRRCDRRTRRFPKWLKTVIVWILFINLLPVGVEWIQSGIGRAVAESAPQPEPALSRSAVKLWQGEDITIWTDRLGSDPTAIPILVENNTRDDIAVSSWDICLGDYQTSESFLYVEADKRSWGTGYLYLDEEEMKEAGAGEDILFCLEIYDTDSYDTIALIDTIAIPLE